MSVVTFKGAASELWNRRIKNIRPLIPPQILHEDYPLCVAHGDSMCMLKRPAARSSPPTLLCRVVALQKLFSEGTTTAL